MTQRLNVISRTELCKQLGISRSTIKRWITQRDFPSPIPASGREPLFNMNAVQGWLDMKGVHHG
jgi:excisionase family DNA binding protein